MKSLLVCILALECGLASAQTFKCNVGGSTVVQDRPCPGTVRRSDDMPRSADMKTSTDSGAILCKDQAVNFIAWKDKESLRIGDVYGGKMASFDSGSVRGAGRQYFVKVNGKNSFGGYTGNKPLICYTTEDGTKILYVDGILLGAN